MWTCRDEILKHARRLAAASTDGTFTLEELLRAMRDAGTAYAESTVRTHVTSRLCAGAPGHHAVVYDDLEKVGRGRYRVLPTAGGAAASRGLRSP